MAEDLNLSELTEDQQLAVQQYTSVTDQELKDALPLLRRCEFNVQIAIARFFDGEPPMINEPLPPTATSRRTQVLAHDLAAQDSARATRSQIRYETAYRVSALPDSQRHRLAPLLLIIVMTPLNVIISVLSRTFGLAPILLRLRERFLNRTRSQNARRTFGSRRQLDSQDTTIRFLRELEESYGPVPVPFEKSGYGQAFDKAKRELKFLVVIPISPEHDDTDCFTRQTLLSETVISFFVEHTQDIVLWAGSIEDSEPFEVANSLRLTRFPATAVIAHTPGVSSTAMSVLKRITGPVSSSEYVAQIQAIIVQHEQELGRVRATRQEQQASRTLREQQNSAYERSLATDRERVKQRKAAEEVAKRDAERARRSAEDADLLAKQRVMWRRWRIRCIKPEPSGASSETVRISLRMPQGQRIVRRFGAKDTMDELYAFVDCQAEDPVNIAITEPLDEAPEDYDHQYDFQLVSTLPREVHGWSAEDTIQQRLGKSANLIVEPLEQSDGDDDDGSLG